MSACGRSTRGRTGTQSGGHDAQTQGDIGDASLELRGEGGADDRDGTFRSASGGRQRQRSQALKRMLEDTGTVTRAETTETDEKRRDATRG